MPRSRECKRAKENKDTYRCIYVCYMGRRKGKNKERYMKCFVFTISFMYSAKTIGNYILYFLRPFWSHIFSFHSIYSYLPDTIVISTRSQAINVRPSAFCRIFISYISHLCKYFEIYIHMNIYCVCVNEYMDRVYIYTYTYIIHVFQSLWLVVKFVFPIDPLRREEISEGEFLYLIFSFLHTILFTFMSFIHSLLFSLFNVKSDERWNEAYICIKGGHMRLNSIGIKRTFPGYAIDSVLNILCFM